MNTVRPGRVLALVIFLLLYIALSPVLVEVFSNLFNAFIQENTELFVVQELVEEQNANSTTTLIVKKDYSTTVSKLVPVAIYFILLLLLLAVVKKVRI